MQTFFVGLESHQDTTHLFQRVSGSEINALWRPCITLLKEMQG